MAVAYSTQGASSGSGDVAINVPHPAGIQAGQLLALWVVNKTSSATPSNPGGAWFLGATAVGGLGADGGNQTGTVRVTLFLKIADGTETGNLAVSIPGAIISGGRMSRFTRAANTAFGIAIVFAAFATGSTPNWSVLMGSDPDVRVGDVLLAVSGSNSNGQSFTLEALSQPGCTFGSETERDDAGLTINSKTARSVASSHVVTAGKSTGAPTYSMLGSGSTATSPTGATILLRVRETMKGSIPISLSPAGVLSGVGRLVGNVPMSIAFAGDLTGFPVVRGAVLATIGSGLLPSPEVETSADETVASSSIRDPEVETDYVERE